MYDQTKQSQGSGSQFQNLLSQKQLADRAFNNNQNFDMRSVRSGRSGLGGIGAISSRNDDEFDARSEMEMMVMQGAADVVRQEYIAEPTKRNSLFKENEDKLPTTRIRQITTNESIIKMMIAMICFSVTTILFKEMYKNYRHTIWEDIYGRGIVFFVCSIIQYLVQQGPMSVFDLRQTIRYAFFLRVICISLAYIFLFVAIQQTSSFAYVALIISLLPPTQKLAQRYAMIEKKFSNWDLLASGVAIFGLVFLFRSGSKFTNNYTENYDNLKAFIYGILTILFWGFGNVILQKQKSYVNHHVDTFYIGLFTALIIPAFILGFFSLHPTRLTYEWIQFGYFIVSGVLWWIFHSMFTDVMENDPTNDFLPLIYIFFALTVIVDGFGLHQTLDRVQIIASVLIVGPNVTLIVLRKLKFIT
uniref:Uncharacterized protein n=1 Tax=Oxytricha trifallax TaxID=94289 RepID=Q49I48_OXYTR|nr:hypothetical protein [Sterkiella histriomuscorum]